MPECNLMNSCTGNVDQAIMPARQSSFLPLFPVDDSDLRSALGSGFDSDLLAESDLAEDESLVVDFLSASEAFL